MNLKIIGIIVLVLAVAAVMQFGGSPADSTLASLPSSSNSTVKSSPVNGLMGQTTADAAKRPPAAPVTQAAEVPPAANDAMVGYAPAAAAAAGAAPSTELPPTTWEDAPSGAAPVPAGGR